MSQREKAQCTEEDFFYSHDLSKQFKMMWVILGVYVEESQQLKKVGLKITMPRLKILQIFEQSEERHLSAERIYNLLCKMGEDVGLATVYRVLTQFEAAGLLSRHYFEEGYAVFELRQGPHHDHLVCVKCGRVEEFIDHEIERRQHLVAARAQFQMMNHALNIYGICAPCHQL